MPAAVSHGSLESLPDSGRGSYFPQEEHIHIPYSPTRMASSPPPKHRKPLSSFLRSLFLLVSDPANGSIVCWSSNGGTGRSFLIRDVGRFQAEILPKYYTCVHSHRRAHLTVHAFESTESIRLHTGIMTLACSSSVGVLVSVLQRHARPVCANLKQASPAFGRGYAHTQGNQIAKRG